MTRRSILGIRDSKKFLKELEESKKKNFEDNMRFVEFRALWLKRRSNRDWSRRQKMIIDQVYRSNRHMRIKVRA